MGNRPEELVSDAEVEAWHRDGAICLRGKFTREWIDRLARGIERNLKEHVPGVTSVVAVN